VRRLLAVLVLLVATGCSDTATVDVRGVDGGAAPPTDARLVEATWPDTAAWIAREADAGRPTVMNVFASWCEPCREEMPAVLDVAADNPDVAFLGIDHLDLRRNGTAFVDEFDVDIPTLFDPGGNVAIAIGARGMPTTAFFDADGVLRHLHTGPITAEELERRIDDVRP
jgi:thiol-disulfide isomerase/thioredoxin